MPEVDFLLKIFTTLLIATATVEQSFSALNRLRVYLRIRPVEEGLSDHSKSASKSVADSTLAVMGKPHKIKIAM